MSDERMSSTTIWSLWLFTLILYGLFAIAADKTPPPLPAIILSIWLASTVVASVITWGWIKSKERDEADQ